MAVEHHAGRDAERRAGAGADGYAPFLWPLIWTASAGAAAASLFESAAQHWLALGDGTPPEPEWTTPNTVALELPSMRLRDFSKGERGRPTIVCAPYALHGATIVDFAPGHSLVEALRRGGLARLLVTDSALGDTRDAVLLDRHLSGGPQRRGRRTDPRPSI